MRKKIGRPAYPPEEGKVLRAVKVPPVLRDIYEIIVPKGTGEK